MPSGVAFRDAREQLFAAAERVLLRDGPSGLTSRAVTTEAGCAKGVLHHHFGDFEEFLAALVRERIAEIAEQSTALRAAAGGATVVGNLTTALTTVFETVAVAIVGLVTSRDDLRARLRATTPSGVPVLTEATAMLAAYLAAERDRGRLAPDADVDVLAPMLIGAGHLLFAGRDRPPTRRAVAKVVASVVAGALPRAGA